MEKKQLNYTVAGKNYLLISMPVSLWVRDKFVKNIEKYHCIVQSGVMEKGFWADTMQCDILVPEENIFDFSKNAFN